MLYLFIMMYKKKYIKGNVNSRLYKIWLGIKRRCYNKACKSYKDYGERGITMCDAWKNSYVSFYNWARRARYNKTLSIERIDVNGNYEPKNCKWIPMSEQPKNTRRTIRLTYNNETHTLSEWSEITGISKSVLSSRLRHGWTTERTLTTPVRGTAALLPKAAL